MRFQLIRKENWTHLEIVTVNTDSEFLARKLRNNCKRVVQSFDQESRSPEQVQHSLRIHSD